MICHMVFDQARGQQVFAPLSDEDLAALAQGSTYRMTKYGGLGTGEPYGNVHKLPLVAGKYAFLADNPDRLAADGGGVIPPSQIAILEVLP
jgi:hypothetical protein